MEEVSFGFSPLGMTAVAKSVEGPSIGDAQCAALIARLALRRNAEVSSPRRIPTDIHPHLADDLSFRYAEFMLSASEATPTVR